MSLFNAKVFLFNSILFYIHSLASYCSSLLWVISDSSLLSVLDELAIGDSSLVFALDEVIGDSLGSWIWR